MNIARPTPEGPSGPRPADAVPRWTFRAPCCLTPRQLTAALGGLAVAVGACGTAFTALGFGWIGAFSLLDVLVILAAGLAYARRAGDGDTLTLAGGHLHVHQRRGARTHHTVFQAAFVRVVCTGGPGAALELQEGRRRLAVAPQLRPSDRPAVARALCEALRAAAAFEPTDSVPGAAAAVASADSALPTPFVRPPSDARPQGDAPGHPAPGQPPPPTAQDPAMPQIADVMTLGAHSLPPDATVLAAAHAMATLDVGAIPVCDGPRLVGIVTDRDLVLRVLAAGRPAASTLLHEVMTEDPCWCRDTQPLDEAAERMRALQVRRLPILDRDQRLVGMLSLGDVAVRGDEATAGRALEEGSEPAAPARAA